MRSRARITRAQFALLSHPRAAEWALNGEGLVFHYKIIAVGREVNLVNFEQLTRVWETGNVAKKRELVWIETPVFTGCGCNLCPWKDQVPKVTATSKTPSLETHDAFQHH